MKSKVCIVMPGFHLTVHNFCNKLSEYFDVHLLLPRRLYLGGIEDKNYSLTLFSSMDFFGELPLSFNLINLIRIIAPDIIITGEDFQPNTIQLSFISRVMKIPFLVINEKYFDSRVNYLRPIHKIIRVLFTKPFVWKQACRILPRTEAASKYAMDNGAPKDKITVLPMGIDISNGEWTNKKSHSPDLELLSVGRLIHIKGFHHIIKALSILKEEDIHPRLTIVGDGPLEKQLRSLAERRGVGEKITFINQVPHSQLIFEYKKYDVYLQVSTVEVVGLAALEALSSGCALIVSDIGGLADIVVNGKNGYKIQVNDPYALAHSIRRLHENRTTLLTMQKESIKRSQEVFSWDKVIVSYIDTIKSCLHMNRYASRRSG